MPEGRVEIRGVIKRAAGVWGRRRTMLVGECHQGDRERKMCGANQHQVVGRREDRADRQRWGMCGKLWDKRGQSG